jgi:hypothetical protein
MARTFQFDEPFALGLNVLWADNTKGKSTCLQDLLYALGLDQKGRGESADANRGPPTVTEDGPPHMPNLRSRARSLGGAALPGARRLTAEDIEGLDMLAELAGDPELRLDMNFMPGDVQFLHNHTIRQARSAYEDWPEPDRKRHLLRLWLSPPAPARRAPWRFLCREIPA